MEKSKIISFRVSEKLKEKMKTYFSKYGHGTQQVILEMFIKDLIEDIEKQKKGTSVDKMFEALSKRFYHHEVSYPKKPNLKIDKKNTNKETEK